MERLTERIGEHVRIIGCKTMYSAGSERQRLNNAIVRLAEYEDKNLLPDEVEPVRHGYWVKRKEDALIHWDCSECSIAFLDDIGLDKYFYCPRCGAKMDAKN